MSIPEDAQKYKKAKRYVDAIYGPKTSAYRSMAIVKKYKQLGGKYLKSKKRSTTTTRWLNEKWIQVTPYLAKGQRIRCGSGDRRKHACRPSVRVSKNTPLTIQELTKIHDKSVLLLLASMKKINSELVSVDWAKGRVRL